MVVVNIVPKGSAPQKLMGKLGPEYFNILAEAVTKAAVIVRDEWKNMTDESRSPAGWRERYRQSITFNKEGDLSATVQPQGPNAMFANFVEDGVKSFPMIPGLVNGPHSRVNKKGIRYNIVYMRKGTPGAQKIQNMPESMYAQVKGVPNAERMKVEGVGGRMRFANKKIKLNSKIYTKGYQRFDYPPEAEKEKKKFSGMVKGGATGHSQYGTFRVVTMKSKGWIYPGVDASPIFDKLVKKMVPVVKRILLRGMDSDLENMMDSITAGQK